MFQSTRPVRGATLDDLSELASDIVSIHAPRAGRDVACILSSFATSSFNPRAPCGARHHDSPPGSTRNAFQSTRPVRGATLNPKVAHPSTLFQSTRPVRGATHDLICNRCKRVFQSTRPVRGATSTSSPFRTGPLFQSTRPVRGATAVLVVLSVLLLFQSTRPVRGATRH